MPAAPSLRRRQAAAPRVQMSEFNGARKRRPVRRRARLFGASRSQRCSRTPGRRRGGASTYPPNVNVLFSRPSGDRAQKDGRKVRSCDKGTFTSDRAPPDELVDCAARKGRRRREGTRMRRRARSRATMRGDPDRRPCRGDRAYGHDLDPECIILVSLLIASRRLPRLQQPRVLTRQSEPRRRLWSCARITPRRGSGLQRGGARRSGPGQAIGPPAGA